MAARQSIASFKKKQAASMAKFEKKQAADKLAFQAQQTQKSAERLARIIQQSDKEELASEAQQTQKNGERFAHMIQQQYEEEKEFAEKQAEERNVFLEAYLKLDAKIAASAAETAAANAEIAELQACLWNWLAQDKEEADQPKPTDPKTVDFDIDSQLSEAPAIAPPPPRSAQAAVSSDARRKDGTTQLNGAPARRSNRLRKEGDVVDTGPPPPTQNERIDSMRAVPAATIVAAYMAVHNNTWVDPVDTKKGGPVGIALKDPTFLAVIGGAWPNPEQADRCKVIQQLQKAKKAVEESIC
jgi:hypothetical protein